MKIITFLIFSFFFTSVKSQTANNRANSVLQKVSEKLNNLHSISYDLERELNYPSNNYHRESEWHEYFEFQTKDTLNFKYQIEDTTGKQIFNGAEKFDLDQKTKTIEIIHHPNQESFQDLSALYNSILTLKNILPAIINDTAAIKTFGDTTLDNKSYYLITISIGKRRIKNLGDGFYTLKFNSIYKIIIDKRSDLPFGIIQPTNHTDFIKIIFLNINTNEEPLPEYSWYYSTYTNEYKQAIQKDIPQLIPIGSIALDWTLPLYNKNENISLSKLKGKVVLLDFWFKNCGPCIESVPHLNALQEKFENQKFEILGINTYDAQKDISWFCNKQKIRYKVLMNGKDIAEKYGVDGYPTIILIDKKGEVFYSGGFDQAKIEELIEKAL